MKHSYLIVNETNTWYNYVAQEEPIHSFKKQCYKETTTKKPETPETWTHETRNKLKQNEYNLTVWRNP